MRRVLIPSAGGYEKLESGKTIGKLVLEPR